MLGTINIVISVRSVSASTSSAAPILLACAAVRPSQQLSKRTLRALRQQSPSTIYKRLPWLTLLPIVVCGCDECASLRLVFVAFSPACCCSTSNPSWPRALPATRWWQPRPRSSDSCSLICPRKLSERSSHMYGSLLFLLPCDEAKAIRAPHAYPFILPSSAHKAI